MSFTTPRRIAAGVAALAIVAGGATAVAATNGGGTDAPAGAATPAAYGATAATDGATPPPPAQSGQGQGAQGEPGPARIRRGALPATARAAAWGPARGSERRLRRRPARAPPHPRGPRDSAGDSGEPLLAGPSRPPASRRCGAATRS